MKPYLFIFTLFISSNTFAYVSSDGSVFDDTYNENGAVFTPVNDTSPKMKLYLGKDCDAYSKIHGKGTWSWANGGFIIKFPSKRFAFGRQEIEIDGSDCPM